MLYNILYPLSDTYPFLNIFKYLTFRSIGAVATAFILAWILGPHLIRYLRRIQGKGQPIRAEGPQSHYSKKGTPTMGGALILMSLSVATLLWADLTNIFVWIVLGVTLSLGFVGGWDDYIKVSKQNTKGMFSKTKFLLQLLISAIAGFLIMRALPDTLNTHIAFPFVKDLLLSCGVFFIPFAMVVITGSSNAVNLTDGLDGLASGPIIIAAACFSIIAYIVGNSVFAHYLQIHFVPGAGELSIICGAMVGAGLGFLWFNAPPAQVFMGDMGSLALGGALGTMSLITKHEIVLVIIGGLFVIETVSVILQVAYFKCTGGKRIFLMAPLHHHFEKKGWSESTVVIRFWIVALILALIGLSTLKLR